VFIVHAFNFITFLTELAKICKQQSEPASQAWFSKTDASSFSKNISKTPLSRRKNL